MRTVAGPSGGSDLAFLAATMQSEMTSNAAKTARTISDEAHDTEIAAERVEVDKLHEKADAMRSGAIASFAVTVAASVASAVAAGYSGAAAENGASLDRAKVDGNAANIEKFGKAAASFETTSKFISAGAKAAEATGGFISKFQDSHAADLDADSRWAASRAGEAKKRVDAADQNAQTAKSASDKASSAYEQAAQDRIAVLRALASKI